LQSQLESNLVEGFKIREIDKGILSVLPAAPEYRQYDVWTRAMFYDLIVASRLYNRLVWDTSPDHYKAFEQQALESDKNGWMLNAGCGSLVFTDKLFGKHKGRPIVLLDQSIRMLQRAKQRLEAINGKISDSVVLLQADIFKLPFKIGTFKTVSFPGVLHVFDDPLKPVKLLLKVLSGHGVMYISSLVHVPGRSFAGAYLRCLHLGGEIAAPRSEYELVDQLSTIEGLSNLTHHTKGNMAYFTLVQSAPVIRS